MHQLRFSSALAGLVVACGLIIAPAARAATGATTGTGATCQPVVPGSNAKLGFKATGVRNESTTTGSFVICPLPSTVTFGSNAFTDVWLQIFSIDGASHDVTCTAVTGDQTNFMQYSSKTVTVAGTNQATPEWTGIDFGKPAGEAIGDSVAFSVTCALPPQTMIRTINGWFLY